MKIYEYIDVFTYISPVVLSIGVILGLYNYKKLDKTNKLLFIYLLISLLIDFTARYLGYVKANNLILWPLLSILELLIFSKIYQQYSKKKKLINFLFGIGALYIIIEIIYVDTYNITEYQSYSKVISSVFIVFMVLIYIFDRINEELKSIKSNLYLGIAILIYFSLNVVLLLPMNFLINEGSNLTLYIWLVYLIMTIMFYSFLNYLIWKSGRNQRQ